jgi:hypothetical protein
LCTPKYVQARANVIKYFCSKKRCERKENEIVKRVFKTTQLSVPEIGSSANNAMSSPLSLFEMLQSFLMN